MKLHNKYYILRHGEAISNAKHIASSWPEKFKNPLTVNGRKQIKEAVKTLKNKGINLIFSSDLLRTRQTAEIIGRTLKIKPKFDKRLREVSFGDINGRPAEDLFYLGSEKDRLKNGPKKSESYENVLKRVIDFLKDIDGGYRRKNILIISHQCPLWILENKVKGFSMEEGLKRNPEEKRISKGEIRKLK